MEWWKTWELDNVVYWTAMHEVHGKEILRAWVCGQCSEIGGDSCDRERERESLERGREEKKSKWERKREICVEGRERKVR